MNIEVTIEKIFYSNDKWASCLVSGVSRRVLIEAGAKTSGFTSVAGDIRNAHVGMKYKMTGNWVNTPKYGVQFDCSYSEMILTGNKAVYGYLTSGFIKGVGPKLAEVMIEHFGASKIMDVIKNTPEKLVVISGISESKAKKIHDSYMETNMYMNIVKEFNGDISDGQVEKIFERYNKDAVDVIRKNPYQLIYDIKGFGFMTVDKLAKKTGIGVNDPRRVKAGIVFTMDSVANNCGHCYINIDDLSKEISNIIKDIQVADETLTEQLVSLIKDGYVIAEGENIYLKYLYDAEINISKKIKKMLGYKSSIYNEKKIDEAITLLSLHGIELEEMQIQAIKNSLSNKVSIITGGPGTGKSTIINAICKSIDRKTQIILLAPTGRASRRMTETTSIDANTICKFNYVLSDKMGTRRNENALYIIDEASMIDLDTANELMYRINEKAHIIFVGDIDQLPSIGAGNFFRDMVKSPVVPKVKLKFTHRFKGLIASNAHKINDGNFNLETGEDFKIIKEKLPESRSKLLLDSYYQALKNADYDYKKVQIIVPQRQRGLTCANTLNTEIRAKVNPPKPFDCHKIDGVNFREGDRVMLIKNNSRLQISNGDMGIIKRIDPFDNYLYIKMDSGALKQFEKKDCENLVLGYAITVHKSQGSEYDTVISAYGTNDFKMLQRNLLYTAVTRAKKKMIMICDMKAIIIAVNNIQPIVRNTKLQERLSA